MRIMVDANLLIRAIFYGSKWITDFLTDLLLDQPAGLQAPVKKQKVKEIRNQRL